MANQFLEAPVLAQNTSDLLYVVDEYVAVSPMGTRMTKNACKDCLFVIVNIGATVPLEYALPLYGYLLPIFVATTTVINTFIVIVLSQKHLRTPTNYVLTSMAVTDLLTGLTSLPWFLYYYTMKGYLVDQRSGLDSFWCHVYPYLSYILPTVWHTAVIFLTVFLAIQRYVYVCVPGSIHRVCTPLTTRKCVIGIVLFSLLTVMPEIFGKYMEKTNVDGRNECTIRYTSWVLDILGVQLYYSMYYWLRAVVVHFLPCILLIIFTYKLARTIKLSDFINSGIDPPASRKCSIAAGPGRTLHATNRMLSVVCSVFLLLEIPAALIFVLHIAIATKVLTIDPRGYHILNVLLILRNILIVLTSPIQFTIYCSMSEQFRLTVRQLFSSKLLFVPQAQATFHGGKRYSLILVDVEKQEENKRAKAKSSFLQVNHRYVYGL
uniref:G-protein coupled receptors family 1 profile domain-containing protein n=1 Tax=Acrobeloides nanus TaxID=290746 RepID=A0A914CAG2_9BILA